MFSPFLFIFCSSLFLEPCLHFPEIYLTNRLINVDVISYEVKYYEDTGKVRGGEGRAK